jgi:hypothetical protein
VGKGILGLDRFHVVEEESVEKEVAGGTREEWAIKRGRGAAVVLVVVLVEVGEEIGSSNSSSSRMMRVMIVLIALMLLCLRSDSKITIRILSVGFLLEGGAAAVVAAGDRYFVFFYIELIMRCLFVVKSNKFF